MESLKLNTNLEKVKCSATLAINEKIKELRRKGFEVVHLGFGESPFEVPEQIVQGLIESAHNKHYLPGEGLHELRCAIANYYQSQFDYPFKREDVFVAPGSKESLFQLLYLLEGPLLLPAPSWVSYEPQANVLNKQVVSIPTKFSNHYCLEADALEKACKAYDPLAQKVLILNSPNNPTGMIYPQESFDELAEVCRENNIIVLSDEIYAGIEFSQSPHTSMMYAYPEGTIVTSGLSKLFSAGGYRLGFALIPSELKRLQKAIKVVISETYSCVSSPVSYAAVNAYESYQDIQPYLKECNLRHQWAGEYLSEEFRRLGLRCHKPHGAFYLMPDFSPFAEQLKAKGIKSDVELCEELLDTVQVATLPGSVFGMDEELYSMRVASVDYSGREALEATSIHDDCFRSLHLAVKKVEAFIKSL